MIVQNLDLNKRHWYSVDLVIKLNMYNMYYTFITQNNVRNRCAQISVNRFDNSMYYYGFKINRASLS